VEAADLYKVLGLEIRQAAICLFLMNAASFGLGGFLL
jgi:hypothetical protein